VPQFLTGEYANERCACKRIGPKPILKSKLSTRYVDAVLVETDSASSTISPHYGLPDTVRDQTRFLRIATLILLALGLGTLIAGFVSTNIWSSLPIDVARDAIRFAAITAVISWVLRFVYPMRYANSLLLVWFAYHVLLVGIVPVLSVLLVTAAAAGAGSLLLPKRVPSRLAFAVISGLGIIAGITGWLLPFPIHFHRGYVIVALAICWWRRRAIAKILLDQRKVWQLRVNASPRLAAVALMALGLASTGTWLPTMGFDDVAYHMGLPTELRTSAHYRMDAASQVWALAPWLGDVVQGITQVIAGEDARSSVNLLWLALAVLLVLELNRRLGGTSQSGWLAVGSVGSIPLMYGLLWSMQGELPAVALYPAAALILVSAPRKADSGRLILLSICIAVSIGLKMSNILGMAPFALWLIVRWRGKLLWREFGVAAVLAVLIAGSSYTYAALLTGNPVLPLFNGWFKSEFFASENFVDTRWLTGIRPDILWQLTFATGDYCECLPGTAGFQWLALAGALPIALVRSRTRGVAICALVGASLVFHQSQYFRYFFPMLVLLLPVFAVSLRKIVSLRVLAFVFICLIALNTLYAPNFSWLFKAGLVRTVVNDPEGREKILRSYAPERLVADYIENQYGKEVRVLLADQTRPFGAAFGGRGFTTGWYDPEVARRLFAGGPDPEPDSWSAVFHHLGISHLLVTDSSQTVRLQQALTAGVAERELRVGDVTLYRLGYGFTPANIRPGEPAHSTVWSRPGEEVGPTITDARVRVECKHPAGIYVSVRAYDYSGKSLQQRFATASCPQTGSMVFEESLLSNVSPSRVEFESSPEVQIVSVDVRLRKDATASRSLAQHIRAWFNDVQSRG